MHTNTYIYIYVVFHYHVYIQRDITVRTCEFHERLPPKNPHKAHLKAPESVVADKPR